MRFPKIKSEMDTLTQSAMDWLPANGAMKSLDKDVILHRLRYLKSQGLAETETDFISEKWCLTKKGIAALTAEH